MAKQSTVSFQKNRKGIFTVSREWEHTISHRTLLAFPTDRYIGIEKGGRMQRFAQDNTVMSLSTAIHLKRYLKFSFYGHWINKHLNHIPMIPKHKKTEPKGKTNGSDLMTFTLFIWTNQKILNISQSLYTKHLKSFLFVALLILKCRDCSIVDRDLIFLINP